MASSSSICRGSIAGPCGTGLRSRCGPPRAGPCPTAGARTRRGSPNPAINNSPNSCMYRPIPFASHSMACVGLPRPVQAGARSDCGFGANRGHRCLACRLFVFPWRTPKLGSCGRGSGTQSRRKSSGIAADLEPGTLGCAPARRSSGNWSLSDYAHVERSSRRARSLYQRAAPRTPVTLRDRCRPRHAHAQLTQRPRPSRPSGSFLAAYCCLIPALPFLPPAAADAGPSTSSVAACSSMPSAAVYSTGLKSLRCRPGVLTPCVSGASCTSRFPVPASGFRAGQTIQAAASSSSSVGSSSRFSNAHGTRSSSGSGAASSGLRPGLQPQQRQQQPQSHRTDASSRRVAAAAAAAAAADGAGSRPAGGDGGLIEEAQVRVCWCECSSSCGGRGGNVQCDTPSKATS